MCGFFTFTPSFLKKRQSVSHLSDYKVFLYGMYPIYQEEISVYQEIGLDRFWHSNNIDIYNVKRKKIIAEDVSENGK